MDYKILERIEKLIDKLPYENATVKITGKGETYELNKDKPTPCGFVQPKQTSK